MQTCRLVLATMVGLCAVGCSSPTVPDGVETPVPVTRLRSEPYSLTLYSGRQPGRLVVRDAATWAEVWTAIWRWQSPAPSLPEVDFTREVVVVAVPGRSVNLVSNFLVDSAVRSRDGVTVQLHTFTPGPGCAITAEIRNPVDVARLPRSEDDVVFAERVIQACP
jgi:hypothetical protein